MRSHVPPRPLVILSLLCVTALTAGLLAAPASGQGDGAILDPLPDPTMSRMTLTLEPFAQLPPSQPSQPPTDARLMRTNRINYVGEVPDGSGRMFAPDLNGKMYLIVDGEPVEYLDVGAEFAPYFWNHAGLGSGFGFVEFHPHFADNGKFYTVHLEGRDLDERPAPDLPHWPQISRHSVITEWTADDPAADTFTGTNREVLRLGFRTNIHGIQQISFNPTAEPGDEDYGLLYIGAGDGGSAHNTDLPQDTSRAEGSILRIDPLGNNSGNGQYGIPDSNPYVDDPDALDEIWAHGVRNPHRFSWDPAGTHRMFLGNIGEWQIESVYEVRKGDNLGWPLRNGEYLHNQSDRWLYPLPDNDDELGFTYPVAGYDHNRLPGQTGDLGVAIVGGFVYRGQIPQLRGLYVFGDIVTGRIFFAEAGARGRPMRQENGMQPVYEFQLRDGNGQPVTMADLAMREGSACIIAPSPIQTCRIDLRFGQDADGELFVTSKASGSIWRITDAQRIPPDRRTVVTDVRSADDWAPVTPSKWQFPGNEVVLAEPGQSRPGPRRPFEYAVLTEGPEWRSFQLDALVRSDQATPIGRDVLIIFGWKSDTEFYYVHLSEDIHDPIHNGIFKVNNADRVRIDDQWDGTTSAPAALKPGINYHKVKVTHDGDTGDIAVYVDGSEEPLMTATDTSLRTGRVGFGSFDDIGRIRGLTVRGTPGPVTLPGPSAAPVVDSLRPNLVNHWDFESPVPGNSAEEQDLGFSETDLWLVNGGPEMRVQDPAYPASTFSLQTKQVNPVNPPSHEDWKAGVFDFGGVESLRAFNAVQGMTIMGWFKQTGTNPNKNTNSSNPTAMFNAVGMAGVLSGDSVGHNVRALLEVINVSGELRLVALARRIDGGSSNTFAADGDWEELFPHDEWAHIAATFDYNTGSMALYRNGQPLTGFYTNTGNPWDIGPPPNFSSATDPTGIKIGGSFPQNTGEQNPCNCRMDGLMFLDRAVTDEEIAAQYEAFVDTSPAMTTVTAGKAEPIWVDLGGNVGPTPFTVSSNEVACDSGQPLGPHEPATTPGNKRYTYDADTGQYLFLWRTDRSWAGTCRQLVVTTDDGAVHTARFEFT